MDQNQEMEHGCAGNTSSSFAGAKRRELDGGMMMNKGEWTGTKKIKTLHESQVGGGGGSSRSRKRPYEYSEDEKKVVYVEKLYKCNYWEDPAYAKKLRIMGLVLARNAARENYFDRVLQEFQAWMDATEHLVPKADGSESEHMDMDS